MNKQTELIEKSLTTLELPTVLDMLASEAVSEPAKARCAELRPATSRWEAERRLGETTAAVKLIGIKGGPHFSGVRDVRGSLARAEAGGSLNTRELIDVASVLASSRGVKSYASGDAGLRTEIDYLFSTLRTNRRLEERITTSIASEDEIADAASPELADIRRLMRAAGARARDALQKIISSPAMQKALQEPIITMRSDRYVVPVKAEFKGAVQGLVHDVSSSGATLFIEPLAVVKANNEIRELTAREVAEIDRILMELSAECAANREDIESDFNVLVALDVIFAKGNLSLKLDCTAPKLTERQVRLRRARHPLLAKDVAVPIDIELGGEFDTLVVTGPNTGGKTVTLKTTGLLCAMAQTGLHIPVADESAVPIFEAILADIGDEQSIAQSLSTFSSHMKNIVRILEAASGSALILLDELGAGTDPTEGAALAIAIIERIRSFGVLTVATTHYAELKMFATTTKGVMNASCEFDVETLRPTYRLIIGIPGKSNAFAISERLGLSKNVIEDAKSRVGSESASFEEILAKLDLQRQLLERNSDDAARKLREAEEARRTADRDRRELAVRLEMADQRARREAEKILEDARAKAENIIAEMEEMRKLTTEETAVQRINEARADLRRQLKEAGEGLQPKEAPVEERKSSRPVKPGDTVEIKSMGIKADVISVSNDRVLELMAGIMKVNLREDEVFLLEAERPRRPAVTPGTGVELNSGGSGAEVDLRGMMADEAVNAAEQFIDRAIMSKLKTVTIIHGKGTGVLREAIRTSLRRNRQVASFRLGRYGEGETGVTVVELK